MTRRILVLVSICVLAIVGLVWVDSGGEEITAFSPPGGTGSKLKRQPSEDIAAMKQRLMKLENATLGRRPVEVVPKPSANQVVPEEQELPAGPVLGPEDAYKMAALSFEAGVYDRNVSRDVEYQLLSANLPGVTVDVAECRGIICKIVVEYDSEDARSGFDGSLTQFAFMKNVHYSGRNHRDQTGRIWVQILIFKPLPHGERPRSAEPAA